MLGISTVSSNGWKPSTSYEDISEFKIKNGGINYYSLPGITTITSTVGSGAVVEPSSFSIGKIKTTEIEDIGYTFPSDSTLEPSALLPQIIDIQSLASFTNIGITSGGRGYGVAPKLLIRDGKTKIVEFNRGVITFDDEVKESSQRNGTRIMFIPDSEIFSNFNFLDHHISTMIWNYVYLNPGLTIIYNNEKFFCKVDFVYTSFNGFSIFCVIQGRFAAIKS